MSIDIDRIAAAICNAYCGDIGAWSVTYDKARDRWREVARSVVENLGITSEFKSLRDIWGDEIVSKDGTVLPAETYVTRLVSRWMVE